MRTAAQHIQKPAALQCSALHNLLVLQCCMPGYPCISKMLVLVLCGSAMSCPSKAGVEWSTPCQAQLDQPGGTTCGY